MNRIGRSCRDARPAAGRARLAGIGLAMAAAAGEARPPSARRPPRRTPLRNRLPSRTGWPRPTRCGQANDFRRGGPDHRWPDEHRLPVRAAAGEPAQERRRGWPFQLTGLSITIPCHAGAATVFVAYADTDVFDLGSSVQSVAMVFERTGGMWKLATAVNHADGPGWPALCTQRTPPTAAPELAPGSYTSDLARVLTRADSGAAQTTQTASPFAVNDFLAGRGSIPALSATQIRQDRQGGVTFTGSFAPAPGPTFALPLANGRGFWMIGNLTQSDTYSAPSGVRAKDWPDGNQVAIPRPAVVHHESDTFTTTYTAIDPLRSGNTAVALDGFFGWPLTAVAS